MNKYNSKNTILPFCFYLTVFFLSSAGNVGLAQKLVAPSTVGPRLQKMAERKAQKLIKKKKTDLRSELKSNVRDLKKGKGLPKARGPEAQTRGASGYTMYDLIEDPDKRTSVQNKGNSRRFVELLGVWWATPSSLNLDLKAKLDSMKNAMLTVDSSEYRIPKYVRGLKKDDKQPITVFGWHPYWNLNLYKTYDYKIVNAISFYSYEINPLDGSNRNANREGVSEFMDGTFTANIREIQDSTLPVSILLSLTLHREDEVRQFLDYNTFAQQNVIDSIISIMRPDRSNANGIEIDIENVPAELTDNYIQFVQKISSAIYKTYPDETSGYKYVYLSVPAKDPKRVYDIQPLENYVDFFIVRGDNFFYDPLADKLEQGPQAPLNFNAASPDYDLQDAIDTYADRIGRYNTNRLILSFPYTGTMWQTQQGKASALIYPYLSYNQIKFDFVAKVKDGFGELDTFAEKNCYTWSFVDSLTYPSVTTTIYFDDAPSYRKKYKLIDKNRMGGVAINALGYDNGFTELWAVLAEEFTEVYIPKDNRLDQVGQISSFFMRNGTIILAALFYIVIFMACGFFLALLDRKTRQRLFESGRFRIFYLSFFTLILFILGSYLGLFHDRNSILSYGIFSGGVIGWLLFKLVRNKQVTQP